MPAIDLARIHALADFEPVARERMDPGAFDYVSGGADAIVVSNHGARQLDRTVAPISALEEVVAAVGGRTEVWVDGGVRRGLDIAVAVALGARCVLVGRPFLWALAAGGQPAVERALAILREELEIAMALLGAPTIGAISRAHLTP